MQNSTHTPVHPTPYPTHLRHPPQHRQCPHYCRPCPGHRCTCRAEQHMTVRPAQCEHASQATLGLGYTRLAACQGTIRSTVIASSRKRYTCRPTAYVWLSGLQRVPRGKVVAGHLVVICTDTCPGVTLGVPGTLLTKGRTAHFCHKKQQCALRDSTHVQAYLHALSARCITGCIGRACAGLRWRTAAGGPVRTVLKGHVAVICRHRWQQE